MTTHTKDREELINSNIRKIALCLLFIYKFKKNSNHFYL